ncbi:MAG: FKBP-type peptidyl-prolyl cis-trans isomerase [Halieaceae bacterium]|nr:FKBP-type peptidyl-prolyl cis-trans isomerase [Halieaceae bacterium]
MDTLSIGPGTRVNLNFALVLEDGSEIDNNFESDPVSFVFGDGNVLAGFEQKLVGLVAGDTKEIAVSPEDGFGQPNPNNVQEVKRSSFGPEELSLGLVCSFADAAGGELPGVIIGLDESTVTVDFNHPLAGRTVIFKVAIHSVEVEEVH